VGPTLLHCRAQAKDNEERSQTFLKPTRDGGVPAQCLRDTSVYLHTDMQLKEPALARTFDSQSRIRRDRLLAFLDGL
jgi:hypothetical protein